MKKKLWAAAIAVLACCPAAAWAQMAHTPSQIEHANLYKDRGVKGRAISEGKAGVTVFQEVPLQPKPEPRLEAIREMSCHADAVVLGTVASQNPMLTPDRSFVFTDSNISIFEVLKENDRAPVYPGQTITVTRPGGTVIVNGKTVSVTLSHFEPFSTGEEYLFFLRFLPKTRDYEAFGNRTLGIKGGQVHSLSGVPLWDESPSDSLNSIATIQDARSISGVPCK